MTGSRTGEKTADIDLDLLRQRAVDPFAERSADLAHYISDPSRRELKYWFDLLLDTGGTGDARMGIQARLDPHVPQRAFMDDVDLSLRCQLELVEARLDAGLDDAWIPSLVPHLGYRNLEDACGCAIVQGDGSVFPCATPAAAGMDEIDRVRIDVAGSERCRRHLEAIRLFDERTGSVLPIRVGDAMAPFSLAVEVVSATELITGLYTHKNDVHGLMDRLTDAVIDWTEMQRSDAGNPWGGHWQWRLPPGCGATLPDDSQMMLSPDLFDEFCAPYLQRIGERFGGFFVHVCGGNWPTLGALARVPGFRGIDSQMGIEQFKQARDIVGPDALILAKIREGATGSIGASADYVRAFLAAARDTRTMVWINAKSTDEAHRLEAIAREFCA